MELGASAGSFERRLLNRALSFLPTSRLSTAAFALLVVGLSLPVSYSEAISVNLVCGNIVDFNHESKVVRLTLLQLLVDQSLHKAWHLDQAWHWALGRGPFLNPDKFDCSAHTHFTNSVANKTQYPHTTSFWRGGIYHPKMSF
jgi:hypothetical protein